MPTDVTARAVVAADVPALTALDRAVDVSWWGEPETDEAQVRHLLEWTGDLPRRSRILHRGDEVAGYACVMSATDSQLAVHPGLDATDRTACYDDLLPWLVSLDTRELDAPSQDAERLVALARHGFEPQRSSFDLEMPASTPLSEPAWPPGVRLRPFDLERDPAAVHALIYSVWTDVPGHHERSIDDWRLIFTGHEGFRPALQVLAWRSGDGDAQGDDRSGDGGGEGESGTDELVGVAICRVYAGTDVWVSQLAVGHSGRGLGLGRAVLTEALRRLAGCEEVEQVGLSVMARNEQALGLYRSIGLQVDREFVICLRD